MKRKLQFGYCLLQYEHNPWLKERMNIGVLLYGSLGEYLKLRTRSWDGRILSAYPNLERANFTEDLRQIERSTRSFFRKGFSEPSLFQPQGTGTSRNGYMDNTLKIGQELSPDMDSSYRWENGGVGLCTSFDDKLEQLFQRFVSGYDKVKTDASRSDSQVWSTFSAKLAARKLDRFIETEKTIQTELGSLKFQAAYKNGALHVIQPLSFDLSDEDRVGAKAAKWASYAEAVRSYSDDCVKPHFVLGRPEKNNLSDSFERAKHYLEKKSGPENVVTEENSEEFVDAIEQQLSRH